MPKSLDTPTAIIKSWKQAITRTPVLVRAADADATYQKENNFELNCFWTYVRGTEYYDAWQLNKFNKRVFADLIPEPDNEFDSCAVIVSIDGLKVGYLSATIAASLHSLLAFCRHNEVYFKTECRVTENLEYLPERIRESKSVRVRKSGISINICLPTFQAIDKFSIPENVLHAALQPLWDAIPTPLRDQIITDHFRLTKQTAESLCTYQHLAPFFPFPEDPAHLLDNKEIDLFLEFRRKTLREQKKEARNERNQLIYKRYKKGLSHKENAKLAGLAPGTVAGIVRKIKIDKEQDGQLTSEPRPFKRKFIRSVDFMDDSKIPSLTAPKKQSASPTQCKTPPLKIDAKPASVPQHPAKQEPTEKQISYIQEQHQRGGALLAIAAEVRLDLNAVKEVLKELDNVN